MHFQQAKIGYIYNFGKQHVSRHKMKRRQNFHLLFYISTYFLGIVLKLLSSSKMKMTMRKWPLQYLLLTF